METRTPITFQQDQTSSTVIAYFDPLKESERTTDDLPLVYL